MAKPRLATTSLAGCFGCHMSILDIDERILKLVELVDFDRSPINDFKTFTSRCAIALRTKSTAKIRSLTGAPSPRFPSKSPRRHRLSAATRAGGHAVR